MNQYQASKGHSVSTKVGLLLCDILEEGVGEGRLGRNTQTWFIGQHFLKKKVANPKCVQIHSNLLKWHVLRLTVVIKDRQQEVRAVLVASRYKTKHDVFSKKMQITKYTCDNIM